MGGGEHAHLLLGDCRGDAFGADNAYQDAIKSYMTYLVEKERLLKLGIPPLPSRNRMGLMMCGKGTIEAGS